MKDLTKTDWRAIGQRVSSGKCTPIFSDRLYDHVLPRLNSLPIVWAKDIEYPLGKNINQTQLSQYLSITIGDNAAKEQYLTFVKAYYVAQKVGIPIDRIINKYGSRLAKVSLSTVLKQLGIFKNGASNIEDTLSILAKLPIPVYITTSFFNFIELALERVGKDPETEVCLWNEQLHKGTKISDSNPMSMLCQMLKQSFNIDELDDLCFELGLEFENLKGATRSGRARELLTYLERRDELHRLIEYGKKVRPHIEWSDFTDRMISNPNGNAVAPTLSSIFKQNFSYQPSYQNPLVFHLYGLETHPYSMALTEDNYLDFLMRISQQKQLIPPWVARTLENHSLLLLGYNIHSWDFRTLFRGLISSRRGSAREISVAIQLKPEEYSRGARAYLEHYFGNVEFKVYWGTAQNFLSEILTYVG